MLFVGTQKHHLNGTRILYEMEFFEQLLLKAYVVGTQKSRLNEVALLSTQNKCLNLACG